MAQLPAVSWWYSFLLVVYAIVVTGRAGSYHSIGGGGRSMGQIWIPRPRPAYRAPVATYISRSRPGSIAKIPNRKPADRQITVPANKILGATAPISGHSFPRVRPGEQKRLPRPVSRPPSAPHTVATPRPSRHHSRTPGTRKPRPSRHHSRIPGTRKPGKRRRHRRPFANYPLVLGSYQGSYQYNSPYLYGQSVSMFAPMVDRPGYWGLDYQPTHNEICGNGEFTCGGSSGQLCPETCKCIADSKNGANATRVNVVVGNKEQGACAPDPAYGSRDLRLAMSDSLPE